MAGNHLFTSESVSAGHPDKMADQISDAILDAILEQDTEARVACETMVKTGMVVLAGEVTTSAVIDYEAIVRDVVNDIGYNSSDIGFDGESCAVLNALGQQSPDIAMGVDRADKESQGAGDQGLMFGYASNETDVLMPAPITYSHLLVAKQAELMKNGTLPFLRPDAKSQVTFRYENDKPVAIDAVVLSTQHNSDIKLSDLQEAIMEEVVKPILPADWLNADTQYHINPTGNFVIGGPVGDCGLTGRKIIVDTTVEWHVMVAVHFLVKTRQRLIVLLLMQVVMWLRTLLLQALQSVVKFKFLTQLVWLSRRQFRLIRLVLARLMTKRLKLWYVSTLTYALTAFLPCLIY